MKLYIPEAYKPLFNEDTTETRHIALTGRSSGKTEAFARKVLLEAEKQQKSFAIFRDREKYIKQNIYQTVKRVADEIGVYNKYKWPKSPPYSIRSKGSNYSIDFFGIEDDPDKVKGYEPLNKELAGVWFEEFGSLSSKDSMNIVSETVSRFMGKDSIWLYSGNPPAQANSWPRIWYNKVKTLPGYRVYETTFADVWHLLTEQNRQQIINSYLTDPVDWRKNYLGEPTTADGLVYNNIEPEKHYIDREQEFDEDIVQWALGVDVAISNDKTAAVLLLKLANGRIITANEFVHDPKSGNRIKLTMEKQAEIIESVYYKLLDGVYVSGHKIPLKNIKHKIIIDTQDFGLRQMLSDRGLPAIKVKRKSIVADIERGRGFIDRNMMYFIEENCPVLLYELDNLLWRENAKRENIKVDNYGTVVRQQHVHGEDDVENAWRYGHSWLTMNQRPTYRLDSLTDYYYKREINIMDINNKHNEKGATKNA